MFLASYTDLSSFWDKNPQMMLEPLFKDIYTSDKSKGKVDSSRLMYGLCFLVDPSEDNKYRNYSIDDKKFLISTEIFGNKEFNWEDPKFQSIIGSFEKILLTPLRRSLKNWRVKLEERDAFLANTKYDIDNAEKLDKILAQTDKLFSQYERIAKALEGEKSETKSRGNKKLSLSDEGEI